jgi:hypothetical protein
MTNDIIKLFSENCIDAFNEGAASLLVENRNRHIGTMLSSERGVYYSKPDFIFRRELEYSLENGWLEQEAWNK